MTESDPAPQRPGFGSHLGFGFALFELFEFKAHFHQIVGHAKANRLVWTRRHRDRNGWQIAEREMRRIGQIQVQLIGLYWCGGLQDCIAGKFGRCGRMIAKIKLQAGSQRIQGQIDNGGRSRRRFNVQRL